MKNKQKNHKKKQKTNAKSKNKLISIASINKRKYYHKLVYKKVWFNMKTNNKN